MRRSTLALAAAVLLSGCAELGYLGHSVAGHLRLVAAARPVDDWLAQPDLQPVLRERLLLSQRLREFSVRELKLPDNNSYRRYADLQRGAAVWNVVAAPELSLSLQQWCFPVMGCVSYRGYFERARADAFAAELRAQGLEVSVYGVPAYSTLGWSGWLGGDPLLNTFIAYPEGELARMVFHELAHQVAYAADDTVFNESFATAVERLGAQRWLGQQPRAEALAQYRQGDARRRDFLALNLRYRERLAALYASTRPDADKRAAKQGLLAELRAEYERLKREQWGGHAGYDAWYASVNNASLALLGAYNELTPQFERLHARLDGDWPRFYAEVRRLAALAKPQRRLELQASSEQGATDGRDPHPP
ncbi:aminopeptidase [Paucibacter soli]|uniref:aminopeptidase n=1 Tax=Paucibacter soli TaxID=3133433 RepID=UPI0030A202A3